MRGPRGGFDHWEYYGTSLLWQVFVHCCILLHYSTDWNMEAVIHQQSVKMTEGKELLRPTLQTLEYCIEEKKRMCSTCFLNLKDPHSSFWETDFQTRNSMSKLLSRTLFSTKWGAAVTQMLFSYFNVILTERADPEFLELFQQVNKYLVSVHWFLVHLDFYIHHC